MLLWVEGNEDRGSWRVGVPRGTGLEGEPDNELFRTSQDRRAQTINRGTGMTAHHPALEPLEERPHLARWVHELTKMRMFV